jgi:hypothetical protein
MCIFFKEKTWQRHICLITSNGRIICIFITFVFVTYAQRTVAESSQNAIAKPFLQSSAHLRERGWEQKGWNKRGHSRIWTMKSNVFFKYFKHSWAQKETPVSGFQQRHSMVIVHVTIMYVVYSITRRSSDWTVVDVWPAQPLCQGAL